jgi:hypothetical protein
MALRQLLRVRCVHDGMEVEADAAEVGRAVKAARAMPRWLRS